MPLNRKPTGAMARIHAGQRTTQASIKDRVTKQNIYEHAETAKVMGRMEKYQATAERAGLELHDAMRTLPRGEVSIESVYVSERYHSLKVRCSLEQTFTDYTPAVMQQEYKEMVEKTKYIVSDTMTVLREEVGI